MQPHHIERFIELVLMQSNSTVDFCLTKLRLLLTIHRMPHLSPAAYARQCNLPVSSTSRHIRELRDGKSGRRRPLVGLGLVQAVPSRDDWRKHEICLSPKGKLLISQFLALGDIHTSPN